MENNRMSVLIVEDEAAVRRSLCHKLNWEELSLKVSGEAQNAEEAYQLIKANSPEIILLDMRMPGMGGMKLMEIISNEYPEIKVIILSGHSDFEYMRQALKCGATDYLLKPVIKEDLKNALQKAIDSITRERRNRVENSYRNNLLNESIPLLRTNLLNKLIMGINLDIPDVLKRLSFLQINLHYRFYVLAVIQVNNLEAVKLTFMNDSALVFLTLENVVAQNLDGVENAVGFKSSATENEFIYIFGFEESAGAPAHLKELFEKAAQILENSNKLTINVSISDPCVRLSDFPTVYRRTSQLWGKKKPGESSGILLSENFYKESQVNTLISFAGTMEIIDYIEQNDRPGLMRLVNELFQQVPDERNLPEWRLEITAKVYFCLEKVLELAGLNVGTVFDERIPSYNDLVASYRQPEELKYGLLKVVTEVADFLAKRKKVDSCKVVRNAREYIDNYYFEDLSLEYLARKFFLNPSYFCELFKKEVGQSFNKYLNMVRIEKAKELMAQGMKPTDVAELVGFKEPAYFCNVFKKYTGQTPSEYRKLEV